MNPWTLIPLLLVILLTPSTRSSATPVSCDELQSKYLSDQITSYPEQLSNPAPHYRLQQALIVAQVMYGRNDVFMTSFEDLDDEFEFGFERIAVGDRVFDYAYSNFPDGNGSGILFIRGTTINSGIVDDGGSFLVNNEYCSIEFDPVLSDARIETACRAAIPEIHRAYPGTRKSMDYDRCVKEAGSQVRVYIYSLDSDPSNVRVYVGRTLTDLLGGHDYLSCSVIMRRSDNHVVSTDCGSAYDK